MAVAVSDLVDQMVFIAIASADDREWIEIQLGSSEQTGSATLSKRRSRAKAARPQLSELAELEAKLRRWSAGRTLVAFEAQLLRERLDAAGWKALPPLVEASELSAAVVPRAGRRSLSHLASELDVAPPDAAIVGAAARATGEIMSVLLDRLDRYDDASLERIAMLAGQAGWTTAPLLASIVHGRVRRSSLHEVKGGQLSSSELAFMTNRVRPDTLKSTKSVQPVDAGEIADVLSGRGSLSQSVPGFELRAQQVEMAEQVGEAMNDDGWLIAEAGTGTGKSLAYLVPSALHALERGERVVISTNTRALQDQLLEKEIPAVAAAIGQERLPKLSASSLKGRANYLCLRRWFGADRQPVHSASDASARAKVHAWLPLTSSGERAELELNGEEEREFDAFSAEGEACLPAHCPFQQRNQCFLYRARRTAEGSHLVVVNHALLLSDLAQGGGVIPDYDRVIVDEAHNLEEQATSHFGFSVPESGLWDQIERIVKIEGAGVGGVLADAATLLMTSALTPRDQERAAAAGERIRGANDRGRRAKASLTDLYAGLRIVCREGGAEDAGYGRSLRLTETIRRKDSFIECEIVFDTLAETLRKLEEDLRYFVETIEEAKPAESETDALLEMYEELLVTLETERVGLMEQSAHLSEAILDPDDGKVYWLEIAPGSERASVHAAPLHVGELLRERLFERMRTVVLTSATLTTGSGFGYIKERLGFDEAKELGLASPFDYQKAALLYLVDDVPEPHLPGYSRVVQQAISGLGVALHGRTLVLFTSYSAMRAAYSAIKPELSAVGIEVLAQRIDGSPANLVERFRSSTGSILLGVATFWEGIDVVGPALSALVITKLPFSVPSDPVFAARGELFDDSFRQYATPQAVLKFKQGFGRLIRSSQDRGVCVVLDRRILTKRYGKSFVAAAPPCTVEAGSVEMLPIRAEEWIDGPSHNNSV